MDTAIRSEEYKGYTINIFQDDNPMSPREWDNLGTMTCFHKRYELGDKHNLKSEDFVGWDEVKAYLINEMKAVIILPLYLYDHSGLRIKVGSFNGLLPQGHAEFDSGMVGFIYVTRSKIMEEYTGKILTKALRDKVVKALEGEVETYDQYLRGSVYGFVINKPVTCDKCGHTEQDTLESVWGYYGDDLEPIITECKEIIDSAEKPCAACNGKGWILTTVYGSAHVPDGTKMIQRCDTCFKYKDDAEAQEAANKEKGEHDGTPHQADTQADAPTGTENLSYGTDGRGVITQVEKAGGGD